MKDGGDEMEEKVRRLVRNMETKEREKRRKEGREKGARSQDVILSNTYIVRRTIGYRAHTRRRVAVPVVV